MISLSPSTKIFGPEGSKSPYVTATPDGRTLQNAAHKERTVEPAHQPKGEAARQRRLTGLFNEALTRPKYNSLRNKWDWTVTLSPPLQHALATISPKIVRSTGLDFVRDFLIATAEYFDADYAMVGRLNPLTNKMRTIAFWSDGIWIPNVSYDLSGTPCDIAVAGDQCVYDDRVAEAFPLDDDLKQMSVRGYVGVRLGGQDSDIGIVNLMYKSPVQNAEIQTAMLKLFQERLTKEIINSEIIERYELSNSWSSNGTLDVDFLTGAVSVPAGVRETIGWVHNRDLICFANFLECVHPEDRSLLNVLTADHSWADQRHECDFRLRTAKGGYRWFNLRLYRLASTEENPSRAIGYLTDVHALVETRLEAVSANRTMGEFLSMTSHEIRTPLNGILGMAQALQIGNLPEKQQEFVRHILDAGWNLTSLLNDMLDLSKLKSGRVEIETTTFNIRETVEKVAHLHRLKAKENSVPLIVEYMPSEGNVERLGDPHRFGQLLHNLLSNAVKFTAQGEVTCRVDLTNDQCVSVEVKDTGIGIPKDKQQRVFQPFTQVDASTTREFGGTGLGLSIVRAIVDAMGDGARIKLDSEEGVGTRVLLTLPFACTDMGLDGISAGGLTESGLGGTRVLVADDNEINRLVVQEFLQDSVSELVFAKDGQEVLERLSEADFDIVFMDIRMPVMDGETALGHILNLSHKGVDVPKVIALTSDAMNHQVEHYLSIGFAGHVAKPFTQEQLLAAIADNLPNEAAA